MDARACNIIRFIDGTDKQFIIPVYQRPYSWKRANCEQLFKDLVAVYKNNYPSHFFGSLVYVEEDTGGVNEYIIIDGQQRITTVSILLLAIRNYLINNKLTSEKINTDKIIKSYITDEYAKEEKKLKLKLVEGDDDAYERLIENTVGEDTNYITTNYNFFYDEFNKMQLSEIEKLYEAITRLMVVNISLKPSNGDDPQLIFESLNSTGLALDEADKIRNYVLMGLSSKEQTKIYRKYWEKLEKSINKQDLSKFIRYYLAVKMRDLPKEDKLYFDFKKYRNNCVISIETLLNDMLEYSKYWVDIKTSKPSDPDYHGHIGRLMFLDVNTATPLIFDLLNAKEHNKITADELKESIKMIESYYVRRMVCGLPISSINKTFISTGSEVDKLVDKENANYFEAFKYSILSKSGKSRFPNDREFDEAFRRYELYNAKPSFRKYVLERLENSTTKERIAVFEQLDNGELTIEHVMPQTMTQEWKESLGDDWELVHNKYLHTIGNLTLTAYNSDYSNLSFKKKKEMPDKGIGFSKLSLNEDIKKNEVWTENEIKKHAEIMSLWAINIWSMPTSTYEGKTDEEWVELDDDYDFTNKVIKKLVFLGDELITTNVSDAYIKINANLFMLDPELYVQLDSRYITTDDKKLRSPYELSKSLYIETNMSSQAKINAIRRLMEQYQFDNSDIRFLVADKPSKFDVV